MNSSGILKRGLAATAISALAVSGLPSLATSASAAPGDSFTVVTTGPALNGGAEGALVRIRALDSTITPANLEVTATGNDAAGSEDTGSQTVDIVSFSGPANDPADNAYEFITLRIKVTTPANGGTATFRLFEDDNAPGLNQLDANEARQPVSINTAGPLTAIDIAPNNQTTPSGVASGPYTVTLRDGGGRTTQLAAGDTLTVVPDAPVTTDNPVIDSTESATGTARFVANPHAAAVGVYAIKVTDSVTPAITTQATLNVVQAANLNAGNVDIVTPAEADSWGGFGDGTNGGTTSVRVDQNMVTFNFKTGAAQKGSNVSLKVDGANGVTFGGNDKATYTTTLDANGNGSIPVSPQNVTDAGSFTVDVNGFTQTLTFDRAAANTVTGASTTTFCKVSAPCVVTAVVTDQFGDPITKGEVGAKRTGPSNTDATAQRKPVGADGSVEFTFTDAAAINNGTDKVAFDYFVDAFDVTPGPSGTTTIRYNATGQGSDYVISLDSNSTEAPTYTPDTAAVIPLFDANANTANEDAIIGITGGEPNQQVTLSVDNGALILAPNQTDLSRGAATMKSKLTAAGALPNDYRVVGTKSGLVTLTVTTANRVETAKLNVKAQKDGASARNVTVSGPATTPNGSNQVTFTAVVTDAFGNPVQGAGVFLNAQVTGPGFVQDGDVVTDELGQVKLNVRLDDNAEGPVTLKLDGINAQFGAQADRLSRNSTNDDGKGLTASASTASATTTVEAGTTPPAPEPEPEPEPGKADIVAKTKGKNNGGKNDKVKVVTAPRRAAAGAKVVLFKVVGNKTGNKKRKVAVKRLDAKGKAIFIVKDKNGRNKTRYFSRVKGTADSKRARSNNRGLR